ncbi:MAG: NAD(P)-dependent oxidoreductase, partial [Leadbetterella sp.]
MNTLFPIFLKAETMHFLIVGGGNVGIEKLEAVLRNSPQTEVTLVAPIVREEIIDLAKHHTIHVFHEPYHSKF